MLARLGSLEMRARMIVEGMMSGQHRSPMQGFSVEFAQHRQYVAGDDLRFLDWKVMAKTDKLYLKQYVRETNLDLMVLVDVSASMGYTSGTRFTGGRARSELMNQGRPARGKGRKIQEPLPGATGPGAGVPAGWRKIDHAGALAVAVAHLALMQADRVGLAVFADEVQRSTRLSNNTNHWRNITQAMAETDLVGHPEQGAPHSAKPTASTLRGRTDLTAMFDRMTAGLQRKSLVVLISDLFDDADAIERGLAKLRHRGHDAVVLQLMDPAELSFPFRGVSEFMGLEDEGRLPLDPQAVRGAYLEVVAKHRAAVAQSCQKFRFDYLLMDTSEPLGAPLSMFLARRAAMIARGS